MRSAAAWPWAIAAVLGVTVAANVLLLWQANAPNAARVEPDYYRRALAWDSTQAARSRSATLGWHARAVFGPPARVGTPLDVSLADSQGAPIAGAEVRVLAIHNLGSGAPLGWALTETAPGHYGTAVRVPHAGRWELRIEASRNHERFLTVLHAEAQAWVAR